MPFMAVQLMLIILIFLNNDYYGVYRINSRGAIDYYFNGCDNEPNLLLAKDWWEKAIDMGSTGAAMFYEKYFGAKTKVLSFLSRQ